MDVVMRVRFFMIAAALLLAVGIPALADSTDNLLINGDFSAGSGNRPTAWRRESWIDRPTTAFSWIPPFGDEQGEIEINNEKLNDARWVQSVVVGPGLYDASAEIFTHAVPPSSWAGAFISIGDQMVASLDVKGNSNWQRREVFFRVSREHTRIDVKLRLAGFMNFAVGQAYFRDAALRKIDRAPEGAMVLDLDANPRLWAGSRWTLLLLWLILVGALVVGWRLLGSASDQ